jgi:hypothetical protein
MEENDVLICAGAKQTGFLRYERSYTREPSHHRLVKHASQAQSRQRPTNRALSMTRTLAPLKVWARAFKVSRASNELHLNSISSETPDSPEEFSVKLQQHIKKSHQCKKQQKQTRF